MVKRAIIALLLLPSVGYAAPPAVNLAQGYLLPFQLSPNGGVFDVPLGQEADGTFRYLQTTNGVLQSATPGGPPGNVAPITIATAGTAVCFASQTIISGVTIVAQRQSAGVITANTSAIEVGSSSVTTSGTGAISPSASISYNAPGQNLSSFCINGVTQGDGAVAFIN